MMQMQITMECLVWKYQIWNKEKCFVPPQSSKWTNHGTQERKPGKHLSPEGSEEAGWENNLVSWEEGQND